MGFKEAFTRGQEEENNLLFDDDAFYYFAISMLTIIILPLAYSVLKPILLQVICRRDANLFKRAQSGTNDKEVLEKVRKEHRMKWLGSSYILKVIVLVVLLFLLKCSVDVLPDQDKIKGFDPYEILEVSPSADQAQIRSAFRKMSIKLHPDKNPDDPQAEQKFIMLTKAYECLTDETMIEKCKKYGNPDGNSAFHVGIALPSFLLKKENRTAFLAVIFLILLVIVPVFVLNALGSIGKFDDNGVQYANYEHFERVLNENLILKQCPKIVASTLELMRFKASSQHENNQLVKLSKELIEEAELRKITNFELTELMEQNKKNKLKRVPFTISKSFILVYAHLLNKEIPDVSQSDYDYIVKITPKIMQSMVQYALQFCNRLQVARMKQAGRFMTKFMGLRCCLTLLDFSQAMVQGLWEKDPDVYQLNFYRKESSKYMKREKYPELADLIKQPRETRNLPNYVPENLRSALHDEIDLFPRLIVTHKLKIEDESVEEMTTDDFLTLTITLTRDNTLEGQEAPFVHSNKFTNLREETWHVFLAIEEEVFFYKRVIFSQRTHDVECKFIPKAIFGSLTNIKFDAVVKSDCYKGLDHEIPINIKLKSIKDVNRTVQYHKDDEKLDKELPFINRMLNPLVQPQENSDSEDTDGEQKPEKQSPSKSPPQKEKVD